jgi:hypothetical protein
MKLDDCTVLDFMMSTSSMVCVDEVSARLDSSLVLGPAGLSSSRLRFSRGALRTRRNPHETHNGSTTRCEPATQHGNNEDVDTLLNIGSSAMSHVIPDGALSSRCERAVGVAGARRDYFSRSAEGLGRA